MHLLVAAFDQANISLPLLLATVALLLFALIAILALNRLLRGWLRRVEATVPMSYETVLSLTRVVSGGLWLVTALLFASGIVLAASQRGQFSEAWGAVTGETRAKEPAR